LLDFWATWCPPCQKPMGHNQEMLAKNAATWGDRVRLIGLSIDGDAGTVKNHVESKQWTKVEHWWIRNGKCKDDEAYAFSGVPHVCLVDTTGTIVFKGHPASRPDLEEDINKLLRGEKIDSADENEESGSTTAGVSDAEGHVERFNKEAEEFMN